MIDNSKLQETFDFFKNVLFEKIIKPKIMSLPPISTSYLRDFKIMDIEVSEEFIINNYNNTIYPEFIVTYDGFLAGSGDLIREQIRKIIRVSTNNFYPSDALVFIRPNIHLIYKDKK